MFVVSINNSEIITIKLCSHSYMSIWEETAESNSSKIISTMLSSSARKIPQVYTCNKLENNTMLIIGVMVKDSTNSVAVATSTSNNN